LCDRAFDLERHLAANARQRSQMLREYDVDHIRLPSITLRREQDDLYFLWPPDAWCGRLGGEHLACS
jgi:hypothetical protein